MSETKNIAEKLFEVLNNSDNQKTRELAQKLKALDIIAHRIGMDTKDKKHNLAKLGETYIPSKFLS